MRTAESSQQDRPTPGSSGRPAPPAERRDQGRRRWEAGPGWRSVLLFVVIIVLNYALFRALFDTAGERVEVPYTPTFLQQVRDGNVESISSRGGTIQGTFEQAVRYPPEDEDAEEAEEFSTEVPAFANTETLDRLLRENGVVVNAEPVDAGSPWWLTLLLGFGPALLFIGLWVWLLRRSSQAAGGGMLSFGRAKPKRYAPTKEQVTFADVAGIDEAEQELSEIVGFLRDPSKYRRLGARMPRGVLLTGAPGTGKTLLARAVAGEADVPFFSMAASEFVEMIVGVGASRVRDLFAQAKEAAPSIVFVDEIDAIGRSRGGGIAGFSGANDEREQTLNQILTEMDGFDPSTNVIVLAATNRPDVLDPALLRAGRFDRRIAIQPPDKRGRKQILQVHVRSIPLADDVDLDDLAAATVGMVGADLANLANEAALLAARRSRERVQMADFTDALERILLGAERKLVLSLGDRRRTAYHEAGHALVGMLTPGADPVRKISIIPRGGALGVTLATPEVDRFSYEKEHLLARIKVAVGGRAAEQLVFGEETTGAENDIRQATDLARNMVGRWGMSEKVGLVSVFTEDGQAWTAPGFTQASERTRQLVDDEVRKIVDGAHDDAMRLLADNRERLDGLAQALIDEETLDEREAYAAAGVDPES